METYEKNRLYTVALDDLRPDPNQPRKYVDPVAMEELTASVGRMGVIQPVICRQEATGELYVVAGERRCVAAANAGLAAVPAIFIDGANKAEVALVENLLRQDLNPVEEAEALKQLMEEHAYTQEQLAAVIGKARNSLSESLSLNRLPQEIRDKCRKDPTVPKRTLIAIARKKQERSMITEFTRYEEQQKKIAAAEAGGGTTPAKPKKTRAQVVAASAAALTARIGGLDLAAFTAEERTLVKEAMTEFKAALDKALTPVPTTPKPKTKMKKGVGNLSRKTKR